MTTSQQDVNVRIDERIRLVSAVLAATDWPDKAQASRPHGTHPHARNTSRHLKEFKSHEAVKGMQGLLDQGAPLEAMYTLVMHLPWPSLEIKTLPGWVPPKWNLHLRDFSEKANLPAFFENEAEYWNGALDEATRMFDGVALKPFLATFMGPIEDDLVFAPNICYPADREICVRVGKELVGIIPPRLAWGDSAPWPYDDDPAYTQRIALEQYTRILLMGFLRNNADKAAAAAGAELPVSDQFKARYPTWQEQFVTLFVAAVVAIYLEDHAHATEAKSFVLMERKATGMIILPSVIRVLRRYIEAHESGKYPTFIEFMPVFPKQLRVVKRLNAL